MIIGRRFLQTMTLLFFGICILYPFTQTALNQSMLEYAVNPWVVKTALISAFHVFQVVAAIAFTSLLILFFQTRYRPLEKKHHPGHFLIQTFAQIFWVVPSIVFVSLTLFLFRLFGLQEYLYSFWAVKFAWFLGLLPYVVLGLNQWVSELDLHQWFAARSLGANDIQVFKGIIFPNVFNAWVRLLNQCAWVMLTSFSIVILLGGGSPNDTLETGIYQVLRVDSSQISKALALGLWQASILFLVSRLMKYRLKFRPFDNPQNPHARMTQSLLNLKNITAQASAQTLVKFGLLISCFTLVMLIDAIDRRGFDLRPAIQDGVLLAMLSSALTLILSVVIYLSGSRFHWVASSTAWLSPMMLTALWWNQLVWFNQTATSAFWFSGLAQAALFLPWCSKIIYPVLDQINLHEIKAAQSLGASILRAVWDVESRRLRPLIRQLLGWLSALSIAESGVLILFSKNGFEPLALWIQNQFLKFQFHVAEPALAALLVLMLMVVLVSRVEFRRWSKNKDE